MNKTLLSIIAVALIVGGGAFYGGMKYDQSKVSADRQARFQQFGGSNGFGWQRGTRGANGSGFASGEILSKDDKSVTIKMRDGGSKIIFYSDTTEVGKFVNGTLSDLEVGKNVSVNGKVNSDGSITADSIQIRPAMPTQQQ
jgi:hypothetical protein